MIGRTLNAGIELDPIQLFSHGRLRFTVYYHSPERNMLDKRYIVNHLQPSSYQIRNLRKIGSITSAVFQLIIPP